MKRIKLITLCFTLAILSYATTSLVRVDQIKLSKSKYAHLQSHIVECYDSFDLFSASKSTMNEMALNCCLTWYMCNQIQKKNEVVHGGIVRGDKNKKELSLVFTGHEFADGADIILGKLRENAVKGTFFLTGDFYRNYPSLVRRLQEEGHYMGPHSDKHLLYADWTKRDSTLLTKDKFVADLQNNYVAMTEVGLKLEQPNYFMPPYEWYNEEVSDWAKDLGVKIVNFTPGTTSNADYTTPDMSNYRSSDQIYEAILSFEEKESLNGFIMLIHIGTHPDRTDKLYNKLDNLIIELKGRGYKFLRIDELLQ